MMTHLHLVPDDGRVTKPKHHEPHISTSGRDGVAKVRTFGSGAPRIAIPELQQAFTAHSRIRGVGIPMQPQELDVISYIITIGMPPKNGDDLHRWLASRPGERTALMSITAELCIDKARASKSITSLRDRGLIETSRGDPQTIKATEKLHALGIEILWRHVIRTTDAKLVGTMVEQIGWDKLMTRLDGVFETTKGRNCEPSKKVDRAWALRLIAVSSDDITAPDQG